MLNCDQVYIVMQARPNRTRTMNPNPKFSAGPLRLECQSDLDGALAELAARDRRLARVHQRCGAIALRRREAGLAGLLGIIVSQQLSIASAAAIWQRVADAYDANDARQLRKARADRLARLGLSGAKIRTLRAVCDAVIGGALDLDTIAAMPADAAHEALTVIHGIGPWTADLYLLFCLGNADAWPAGDLAVQESVRAAFDLDKRPSSRDITAMAEAWRPYRGVAAHLFWAHYKVLKSRDVTADPGARQRSGRARKD